MGLSRKEKYQELRDSLDEDTTASIASGNISSAPFPRIYGDIDRYQHESRAIHSYQKEEATAPKRALPKSDVMNDLLGEVKQYNIENGNRLDDDTQINILRTLDNTSEQKRRTRHIVEMEQEESSGTTMRISRSLSKQSEELSAFMPGQKLTRINPIQSRSGKKTKTFENFEQLAADLVADDPLDEEDQPILGFEEAAPAPEKAQPEQPKEEKRSFMSRIKKAAQAKAEEEPKESTEPKAAQEQETAQPKKRSHKKSKPSFLFEEPEEENAQEQEPVLQAEQSPEEKLHSKALATQNALIVILVVLLLCSLGLSIFILRKIGII